MNWCAAQTIENLSLKFSVEGRARKISHLRIHSPRAPLCILTSRELARPALGPLVVGVASPSSSSSEMLRRRRRSNLERRTSLLARIHPATHVFSFFPLHFFFFLPPFSTTPIRAEKFAEEARSRWRGREKGRLLTNLLSPFLRPNSFFSWYLLLSCFRRIQGSWR